MNLIILAATSVAFSFGNVSVDCPHRGEWKISLTREVETDGGEVARIVCDAPKAMKPPRFTVVTKVPQVEMDNRWLINTKDCDMPANWGGKVESDIAHGLPLCVAYNGNDQAKFSVAASESVRQVAMVVGIIEHGSYLGCNLTYFAGVEAPLKHYETAIRYNVRTRPFADAVRCESDWITRNAGIVPCKVPDAAFDPLYSCWYSFHQDVFDREIEAECALAAPLGMKTLIVDDGWQTDDNHGGYAFCGDWQISKRRFPDMAAHVKRVQAMGIKYMMWYSVPFVDLKSTNYERFKGKYLGKRETLNTAVLDPRFPEVREFLIGIYVKALKDWNIDGFKLDFIDSFKIYGKDPAEAENYAGRDILSVPAAVDRLMTDVYAALAAIKPDILVEFRQSYDGPAIRRFGNMIRVADCPGNYRRNRYAIANLRLACGDAAVHADMLEWNFKEDPRHSALYIINSIFGVVQYSVMLRQAPESHRAMIAKWIKFSQDHRETLMKGKFTPHHPELDYPLIEAESAAERVIGVYDDGRLIEIADDNKPTFLMNATGRDTLFVRRGGKVREIACPSGDWIRL